MSHASSPVRQSPSRLLAWMRGGSAMAPPLLDQPLSTFVARAPISCAPQTPLASVLARMARESIGAMVVVGADGRPAGVFTLRDLLEKVALSAAPLDAPIERFMTRTVWTLPSNAQGFEAAVLMAREGIRYVLVVDGGRLVGVVSESRLFAAWRGGIGDASAVVRTAADVDAMAAAVAGLRGLVDRLLEERMPSDSVMRVITALNDLVTQRLIEITGAARPLEEARACWLAFGSQGRAEQTLVTDQDNGIVFADDGDVDTRRRSLLPHALKVNEALDRCGYVRCRGDIMASNPAWCLSLREWREQFGHWIDSPDPQAILNATIFFDFRAIDGELSHAAALRAWLVEYAQGRGPFLLTMAQGALGNEPPLGLLRDFRLQRGGDHRGTIDLKVNGIQLFVETARVYSLARGVAATNTLERFAALAGAHAIGAVDAAAYAESFRYLQLLRLRLNARQRAAAGVMHNHLDPATLNELDRRILKEALRQARRLQSRLKRDFSVGTVHFGA